MIEITLVVVVVVLLGLSAANTRVLREYQRGCCSGWVGCALLPGQVWYS